MPLGFGYGYLQWWPLQSTDEWSAFNK
jgi:hypothetical protein